MRTPLPTIDVIMTICSRPCTSHRQPPGYRGLSHTFLNALAALTKAPEGGWWRDVLTRPDLVLAMRAGYLDVYFRGTALFLVGFRQSRVLASMRAKYLLH